MNVRWSILVVDLEATCDDNAPEFDMEIIEVGAVWVAPDGTILDRFQSFARPMVHPTLTPFCTALTGICQADLDTAPAFPAHRQGSRHGKGLRPGRPEA